MAVICPLPLGVLSPWCYTLNIKQCSRWIRQTSPCEPSFCFIYWKAGTQEIVWEGLHSTYYLRMWLCTGVIPTGPDHMQAFMGSEGITKSFKRAVLTRPIYSQKKEGTCTIPYTYGGKLSRENTYTNFSVWEPPTKVFSTKLGHAHPPIPTVAQKGHFHYPFQYFPSPISSFLITNLQFGYFSFPILSFLITNFQFGYFSFPIRIKFYN